MSRFRSIHIIFNCRRVFINCIHIHKNISSPDFKSSKSLEYTLKNGNIIGRLSQSSNGDEFEARFPNLESNLFSLFLWHTLENNCLFYVLYIFWSSIGNHNANLNENCYEVLLHAINLWLNWWYFSITPHLLQKEIIYFLELYFKNLLFNLW